MRHFFRSGPAGNFTGTVINISDLQKNRKRVQLAEYLKVARLLKNDYPLKRNVRYVEKAQKQFHFQKILPVGQR
jgi:hypothetical protein